MTNSQAKSELMQIYMSLSEEKKQALDVLMAQNCDQCEVGNPCLYCEYEFKAQADGEKVFKMRDATPEEQEAIDKYIKSISKPTGVNFWDLADGEYISREAVIDIIEDVCPIYGNDYRYILREKINELPTVDIPPDHDGCKDCKHELKSAGEYPCSYCRQNYKDMWEAKANKVGHWIIPKDIMWENPKCSECGFESADHDNYCPHCGCPMEIER